MGTGSFPGVKCGRGLLLTTHPLLEPRSWKSRAIPLPTLWAFVVCSRVTFTFHLCGPGSSVGIATELWAGRSGIECRWERDFPPVQTGLWAHPASCTMGTGSFRGIKCSRGVLLTIHPLLVPRAAVMEEYSYTSTHPLGHTGPANGVALPLLYIYIYIHTHTYTQ